MKFKARMLMKLKIIDKFSSKNNLKVILEIPENELVFPKSLVIIYLGMPYTAVFLLVFLRSFLVDFTQSTSLMNIVIVLFDPVLLVLLGFIAMLIIGIYYYFVWTREYKNSIILTIEINEKNIILNQQSNFGFKDNLTIPFKSIKQIIFGRSPHGADGWSTVLLITDNKKIPLYIVNNFGIAGMYEFALIIKDYLINQEKLSILRLSESFLKNYKVINSKLVEQQR